MKQVALILNQDLGSLRSKINNTFCIKESLSLVDAYQENYAQKVIRYMESKVHSKDMISILAKPLIAATKQCKRLVLRNLLSGKKADLITDESYDVLDKLNQQLASLRELMVNVGICRKEIDYHLYQSLKNENWGMC